MTARALSLSSSALLVTFMGVACVAKSTNDSGGTDTGNGTDGSGTDTSGGTDSGTDTGADGISLDGGDSGNADGGCGATIEATVRDFKGSNEVGGHPDFEISGLGLKNDDGTIFKGWNDIGCGLVTDTLVGGLPQVNATPTMAGGKSMFGIGAQRRVVGAPATGCWTTANPNATGDCGIGSCTPWTDFSPPGGVIQSASSFGQWYTTTAGVNVELKAQFDLVDDGSGTNTKIYDTAAFFPIDGQGWGNTPGQAHNYGFTTEIHLSFKYEAGQIFTFRGDDDLWIFVNNKLALDVGGAHQALLGSINFDAKAAELGIVAGQTYQMDIFHAERQTTDSNFRIQTNIQCLVNVPVTR